MTGLLLKDYYSLRSYLFKQLTLMAALYILISAFLKSAALLTPMMILSLAMILLSSFSVDEASKWDSYARTLPLSTVKIIAAKYILFLGVLLFGAVAISALCCVLDALFFHEGAMQVLLSAAAVTGLYMLVSAIMLPIFFKYGAEKGRMLMTLVYMIPFFAVIWGGSYLTQTAGIPASLPWTIMIAAAVVVVAVFCIISFFVSIKIYKNKEF